MNRLAGWISLLALCASAAFAQTVIAPRNNTVLTPARPITPTGTIAPAAPRPATPIEGTAQPAPAMKFAVHDSVTVTRPR